MFTASTTRVTRTRPGYGIRIEGRGTMRESPTVHAFAVHVLDSEPGTLAIVLGACEYLDSTFLGCLVDLHKRFGSTEPPRFLVGAGPETRKRLLAPNCLDSLFHYIEDDPEAVGESLVLPTVTLAREDLGRHVLECHRRLVELGGPNQAALRGVVDQLERELVTR